MSFALEVLSFLAENELYNCVWWRTDGEYAPITFFTNTSDLLFWGCADGEAITEETLPILKKAVADCRAIDDAYGAVGIELFSCRLNNMRPQGAAYIKDSRFWPLFDACGPVRDIGLGNPLPQPAKAELAEQRLLEREKNDNRVV